MLWKWIDEKLSAISDFFYSLRREIEYHTELRMALILTVVVIVSSLLYSFYFKATHVGVGRRANEKESLKTTVSKDVFIDSNQASNTTEIVVYITGAVEKPGVYRLKPSSRLYELIELAKPKNDAAIQFMNLAETLTDGEMIYIPTINEAEQFGIKNEIINSVKAGSLSLSKGGKNGSEVVNLNTASEEDLIKIPGIGPKTAQKIIDFRRKKGQIRNLKELLEIPGIGEKTIEKIKNYVTF